MGEEKAHLNSLERGRRAVKLCKRLAG
jgi:hypothetical protein